MDLNLGAIELGACPSSKEEAIRGVGRLLVRQGHVDPGYVESMMAREAVADTYLGSGVAIPHGLAKDAALIRQTGVAFLQVPAGVAWGEEGPAHLVVGIAAASGEHLPLLTRLTALLDAPEALAAVRAAKSPEELSRVLTDLERTSIRDSSGSVKDLALSRSWVVPGSRGLHARPSSAIIEIARHFDAQLRLRNRDKVADGRSLAELLRLGATHGTELVVSAEGPQAEQLLEALEPVLAEDASEEANAPLVVAHGFVAAPGTAALDGVSASPGLAVGRVVHLRRDRVRVDAQAESPEVEADKLDAALAGARAELERLHGDVLARSGAQAAAIFEAHRGFLQDPKLLGRVRELVAAGRSASAAWDRGIREEAAELETLDDPSLAARAADMRDVGQRVLRIIVGALERRLELTEPSILVADDIAPSDTAGLDPKVVVGIATARGGPSSHAAILARASSLPAVCGLSDAVLELPEHVTVVLDGSGGRAYVDPSPADLEAARGAQARLEAAEGAARDARFLPAMTPDGLRVLVEANVAGPAETTRALEAGAEGVGLVRSELLFMGRAEPPSEDEQAEAYGQIVEALGGLPATIRTLDVGGDKPVAYLPMEEEMNPFLGVRGLRLSFEHPEIFETQLRAIHRASTRGPVRILLPMVTTLDELDRARIHVERARAAVGAEPIPLGVMVEVPAVAMMAEAFAAEVDFFSVGTNDLTQYVMAMDRLHPALAKRAEGYHPALLRTIRTIVQSVKGKDCPVAVCGALASEPLGALLLAALGVDEISVTVPSIPEVKAVLRGSSRPQLDRLLERALACRTAEQVRALGEGL